MRIWSFLLYSFLSIFWFSANEIQAAPHSANVQPQVLKAQSATANRFIAWLGENPAQLTKTPVFWSGKPRELEHASEHLNSEVVGKAMISNHDPALGPEGGSNIFDALESAGIKQTEYKHWSTPDDWTVVSAAFARHVVPKSKKAFFVFTNLPGIDSSAAFGMTTSGWNSS